MKKFILFLFITISGFLYACSTSPYLKETELPKNIKYYSADKQFKVEPEWYWRLRPEKERAGMVLSANYGGEPIRNVIGIKYIASHPEHHSTVVVGELILDNELFLIAKWDNNGYFFIKKKDYDFAQKFEKYRVSNNFSYNYKSQKMGVVPTYCYKWTGSAEDGTIGQYHDYYGFQNSFMQYQENTLYERFSKTEGVSVFESYYAYIFIKQFQYTNEMGQVFIGDLNTPTYIIARWGEQWYSMPCDWYISILNK